MDLGEKLKTDLSVSRERGLGQFVDQSNDSLATYNRVAIAMLAQLTVDAISRYGTMHPDGFVKLQIGPNSYARDGQVRLHIWVPGVTTKEEPHSHPWNLLSQVLLGEYREYLPKLTEGEGDKYVYSRFRVVYPSDKCARLAVDKMEGAYDVQKGDLRTYTEGAIHTLAADSFTGDLSERPIHMSAPAKDDGAVTLCVIGPQQAPMSEFYTRQKTAFEPLVTDEVSRAAYDVIAPFRS